MNNRPIKFRVWNNTIKYFVRNLNDEIATFTLLTLSDYLKNNSISNIDDFIFQQYTGVKDKNNNPIYEGDIVKTIYDDTIGVIFYHEQTGSYRIQVKNQLLPIVTYRFVENVPQGLLLVVHEVIGNIFENNDLINT